MAKPNGNVVAVGLKSIRVYELDIHGVPNATGASGAVYEGLQIKGSQSYEIKTPDARRISFKGDDRVLAQDVLPRQEPSTGTLKFGVDNHAAYAILSSTKAATVGEASVIGYGTSKQGSEPVIAVLGYQQAKDIDTGTRQWRGTFVPSTQAIINSPSMTDGEMQYEVSLLPSSAAHHLWGKAFTTAVEGYTSAEVVETITENVPHVVSWLGDNVVTKFLFSTDRPAAATGKINALFTVAADGTVTDILSTATKEVDGVTPVSKPAAGVMVVCFYEYAA
jgi:hypothetical protein